MKNFGEIIKKTILILFIGFFAIEALFIVIPNLLNIDSYKEKIVSVFEKETGEKLDYESLSVKTYPDFSVKISVKKPEIKNITSSEFFETKISIPKLIFKKLVIKDLNADSAKLYIKRYRDNSTNLDNLINDKIFVDVKKLNINNYKIYLEDEVVNQKTEINGELFNANINKQKLDFSIKGNIISQNEQSDIDLSISMPTIDKKQGFKNAKKILFSGRLHKKFSPDNF